MWGKRLCKLMEINVKIECNLCVFHGAKRVEIEGKRWEEGWNSAGKIVGNRVVVWVVRWVVH